MLSFLPDKFLFYINELDFPKLYEIRLRVGYPVKVKIGDECVQLGNGKILCEKVDIDETLKNVTECSLYAFNESLKKGFLTTKQGVRIGVAGECVYDNEKILTIKNVSSLNVRVPHLIYGAAQEIYNYVISDKPYSTLIISPPFYGKTTMLKDLVQKINNLKKYNILIVDERNEFCFLTGECIDSVKYASKDYAFSYGIRSMSPEIIITDELMGDNDWKSVEKAVYSGVTVIASCHGREIDNIKKNKSFIKGLFERYVVLDSTKGKAGVINKVFDGEFNAI